MPTPARVWYFAYGSNMETATFRGRRGIAFTRALPARVAGWRLVLDKPPLIPIGGAVANIVPEQGAHVLGVLYEISRDELAHVELSEGVLLGSYRRVEVHAETLATPTLAATALSLASERRDPTAFPTDRYMRCVIAGAEEHGLPDDWVAFLRAVPVCRERAGMGELIDGVLRALRSPAEPVPTSPAGRGRRRRTSRDRT
jgi:hypothetical protein